MGLFDGRVAIVPGAGRGIGREHALSLAGQGAKVVVNDLGGNVDGTGGDLSPAQQVVEEILRMGGEPVADLHVLVTNAGILRDRMLTNMTEEEWDAVIKVHLKGTFGPARWAAAYWRGRRKAGKEGAGRTLHTHAGSRISR